MEGSKQRVSERTGDERRAAARKRERNRTKRKMDIGKVASNKRQDARPERPKSGLGKTKSGNDRIMRGVRGRYVGRSVERCTSSRMEGKWRATKGSAEQKLRWPVGATEKIMKRRIRGNEKETMNKYVQVWNKKKRKWNEIEEGNGSCLVLRWSQSKEKRWTSFVVEKAKKWKAIECKNKWPNCEWDDEQNKNDSKRFRATKKRNEQEAERETKRRKWCNGSSIWI